MSQIWLPPSWRKPQWHSCKTVACVDSIYSELIHAHQLWAQMVSVAINPIACVPFNVTEPLYSRLPLTLHNSEHVWIQRDGNFCNFIVLCERRLRPLTNEISIKVCVSEASYPRSDRGDMCCSGGGLHYLFAARAFIQKPFCSIEQSGSCKSMWQDFRCLIFKKWSIQGQNLQANENCRKTPFFPKCHLSDRNIKKKLLQ